MLKVIPCFPLEIGIQALQGWSTGCFLFLEKQVAQRKFELHRAAQFLDKAGTESKQQKGTSGE